MDKGRHQIPRAAVVDPADEIVRGPVVVFLLGEQGRVIEHIALFLPHHALGHEAGDEGLDRRGLPAARFLERLTDLGDLLDNADILLYI